MDKCPVCGADTRQGDNYCLNCGQRLLPLTPSPSSAQAQPVIGDATLAAPENWGGDHAPTAAGGWSDPSVPPSAGWSDPGAYAGSGWSDPAMRTVATEQPTVRETSTATAQATMDRIEEPARFILRADSGEVLQEYPLDKPEIVIGRAPTSDILLSKDKLTSRRHAIVRFESNQYLLHDEHSANGTFVNGQQIDETSPYVLKDGDHVGIGEHELIFRSFGSPTGEVEDMPTVAAPYDAPNPEATNRTFSDAMVTVPSNDDFGTQTMEPDGAVEVQASQPAQPEQPEQPAPAPTYASMSSPDLATAYAPPSGSANPEPAVSAPAASTSAPETRTTTERTTMESSDRTALPVVEKQAGDGLNFNNFSGQSLPALPDMSALMAALSTLDGQVMSLQEQFNSTQEAMRNHDAQVAQTANQLRSGIRRVSERMDNTIADVARSREALAWAELLQLMEDVMNNPRDIEYVTKLARKARELNKVFQIHQNVLNTMAECNSLLRSMIGDDGR